MHSPCVEKKTFGITHESNFTVRLRRDYTSQNKIIDINLLLKQFCTKDKTLENGKKELNEIEKYGKNKNYGKKKSLPAIIT